VRHANDFNGFTLEILACPDAMHNRPAPIDGGYTVMIKNPSRHSHPIMDKIIKAFAPLPSSARQSFTFDRGTEFAGLRALEDVIGARSWFCDPSAP